MQLWETAAVSLSSIGESQYCAQGGQNVSITAKTTILSNSFTCAMAHGQS